MPIFLSTTVQAHVACFDKIAGEYLFLLLKRAQDSPIYPGVWQTVTGKIENGETAVDAARREILEETGLTCDKIWTVPFVSTFFDAARDEVHAAPVFGCVVEANCAIKLSGEHSAYRWVALEDIRRTVPLPTHWQGAESFLHDCLLSKNPDLYLYKGIESPESSIAEDKQ